MSENELACRIYSLKLKANSFSQIDLQYEMYGV